MTITLLSCVRDGLSSQVPAGAAPDAAGRIGLEAAATVAGQEAAAVQVQLFGPGDVTGLDGRQVIRMDPPAGAQGSEPNYFCLVEFDRPDLPWLFSPGAPDAQGRLQPWIALVVVPIREGISFEQPAGAPLPVLQVDDLAELPDLADAWAWAHAQIAGDATTAMQITTAVRGSPELTLSRLLCPRLLEANKPYRACVVPTFEVGRLAGLGQAPAGGAALAWTSGAPAPALPVYHHWEFVTGDPGDFETLARKVVAVDPPPGIGTRPLDISDPGAVDLERPGTSLTFAGPLRPRNQVTAPWGDAAAQQALTALVDGTTATVVGPPLYGGRAAGAAKVPLEPTPRPAWLRDLNLDPRHRAAAALGARIVMVNQEALMRAAWEQAGAIEEANRRLRAARMARRAGRSFVEGRLAKVSPPVLLQLGGPALDLLPVRVDGTVARSRLGETRLPPGVTQPAFRRLTRPGGRLGRLLGGPERLGGVTNALDEGRARPDRNNTGRPGGLVTVGGLLAAARAGAVSAGPRGGTAPVDPRRGMAPDVGVRQPTVTATRPAGRRGAVRLELTDRDRVVGGGSTVVEDVRLPSRSALDRMERAVAEPETLDELDGAGRLELDGRVFELTEQIRTGLGDVLFEPAAPPAGPEQQSALAAVRTELLNALDPNATLPTALRVHVRVPETLQGDDPLDDVLAAPDFPAPLAPELAELSGDLLLPGADRAPDDSAFALVTNAAYVQALLVGANHEMARELRWRGFPTDERGTCFHFFWDARETTLDAAGPTPDIRAIHEFAPASRLGDEVGGGRGQVVLVLRAQLFRRYPGTQVLAVPGETAAGGRRPRYDAPVLPRFRGRIGLDILYFGFPFDDVAARGGSTDPGYYAVFQQPPSAPRFGLDEGDDDVDPAVWPARHSDLTWKHVLTEPAVYVDLDGVAQGFSAEPSVRWGESASGQARVTMQQPMRVAIHFSDLLGEA